MRAVARTQQQARRAVFFDGIEPSGILGREEFAAHDPTKSWDDNGVAEQIVADHVADLQERIAEAVRSYGAQQAAEAALQYTAGYLDAGVVDGRAVAVIDLSNETVKTRVLYDLGDFLMSFRRAAEAAGDREALSALAAACEPHVALAPPPMPGERVREESLARLTVPKPGAAIAPRRYPRNGG